MKNVLSKLAIARMHIKANPIKKDGRNSFSNYDYFTPELVGKLVNDACVEANIICVFALKQDEFGFFGEVTTTDLESGEVLVTQMRTDRPDIKATNITQQMGGMNTYAKRYALMSLFDIEDNTIDFDSHDNRGNQHAANQPTAKQLENNDKPWLNKFEKDKVTMTMQWKQVIAALSGGIRTLDQVKAAYKISKENLAELQNI